MHQAAVTAAAVAHQAAVDAAAAADPPEPEPKPATPVAADKVAAPTEDDVKKVIHAAMDNHTVYKEAAVLRALIQGKVPTRHQKHLLDVQKKANIWGRGCRVSRRP